MASVSGTSSIGNTSLRGYGGFATGLDRDALIEQMTKGTTTKINNQKNSMTSMKWKQEAFQGISDKILALEDNYLSYASTTNLKDPLLFAKDKITVIGDSDITKFVSASGTSNMLDYLAISAVKQLATSATMQSNSKTSSPIKSNIDANGLDHTVYKTTNLKGTLLKFGTYASDNTYKNAATFTFPSTYKDGTNPDGTDKIVNIDYTAAPDVLVDQLNKSLEQTNFKLDDDVTIRFQLDGDKLSIKTVDATTPKKADGTYNLVSPKGYVMSDTSSALKALGLDVSSMTEDERKKGVSFDEFERNRGSFSTAYISQQNMIQYLTNKSLNVTYGGQTKTIKLLTSDEAEMIKQTVAGGSEADGLDKLKELLQGRFDKAFGSGKIEVNSGSAGLEFNTLTGQELKIKSNDSELMATLGFNKSHSTNLTTDAKIRDNLDKLGLTETEFGTSGLVINGVTINVSLDDTIDDMINKINANKDVGVKASYLSNQNKFVLIATETGSGRDIDLGAANSAAAKIFGGTSTSGKDALIEVNYGNGMTNEIVSSSNTFDLEGMKVTVSGVFGGDWSNGTWVPDSSESVTFNAKADVDGVTEKIKKFIEEYNTMVTEINSQVTTRPNRTYGPLTDDQKKEMDDKSIENWETQAKAGILFNDSTMRDLSMSMQNVLNELLSSGLEYEDLQEIGISYSEDWGDGGTLVFDEAKFKSAMETDPEQVSNIFTGGGDVKKGLSKIIEDTLTTYATRFPSRNGNSYGRLIEEAGSEKIPNSISKNEIYRRLQDMQKQLETLQERLATEQDRYISQFTTMETMISKMNAQSSWLMQSSG